MIVKRLMYAIATKERPIFFLTYRAELSQDFSDAELFEDPEHILPSLDEPEKFVPVDVEIVAYI